MVKLPCSIRESLHLDQLALLFEEPLIKNLLQILTLALTWLRCHYEFDSKKDLASPPQLLTSYFTPFIVYWLPKCQILALT